VEAWGGVPQGVRDPPGCNVPEFRPCESVLHPCSHRRQLRELYGQARKALKANAKREHNALEWAIGAVEKSTERNVRRSRVNRVADSLDFLSQGSLDFRPDFHERDLGRAAIREMEIGVSAGRRPPAARQFVKWKSASRPAGGHRRVGLLRNALGRRAPRARVSLIELMNASASLTLH
jgi:hypothetical protein